MDLRLKMKLKFLLLSSFIFLMTQKSFSAACCGGGFAAPSIIAGDDKAQLTTSFTNTEVVVDNVDSSGIWRKSQQHQKIKTLRFEGAHIFKDRYQFGFSIPVLQREQFGQTYSGLGDMAMSLGYEYLPDWNYNPYRPKGIGYLQLITPTGKSKAESEVGGLDSRGNGFWALGFGTLLTKSWGAWDLFSNLDLHRSFSKEIDTNSLQGRLNPGLGGNLGIGVGYNLKDYRIGSSITWTYEDPIQVENRIGVTQDGYVERYGTFVANVSYLVSPEWSGTFSYSDQTLFGEPINTSLGRGLALQIQRRWGR